MLPLLYQSFIRRYTIKPNDYEVLVQDQQDMMALELLFEKYDKFIHKKISQFYIFDADRDDFHQGRSNRVTQSRDDV